MKKNTTRKSARRKKVTLPHFLRDLFWEYSKSTLSWPEDSDLITRKILEAGNWEMLKWLLSTAGRDSLRDWLLKRRGAGLDPKRLRFWQNVLGLPEQEVDSWIKENSLNPWQNR